MTEINVKIKDEASSDKVNDSVAKLKAAELTPRRKS